MPAYFNKVHDPLSALHRPLSLLYLLTGSLTRRQAWIILRREAQRYVSIIPSLKTSLI